MSNGDLILDELRSGTEIIHTFIPGNKFDYREIKCSAVDGLAIFEGDILLGTANEMRSRSSPFDIPFDFGIPDTTEEEISSRGIVRTGRRFRWPMRKIPYSIDPNLANKDRVTNAIKHWEDITSFQFVRRGSEGSARHNNYISFENQGGCFSAVGMQGTGKQVISLGPNCTTGNAIHEIGHALGLWHEQSREDRDRYIKVLWQNIEQNKWHNFEQHIVDGDDIGPYDYGSIMHYPRKAFSKNGQDTITPLRSQEIGQRSGLSKNDILTIESVYASI